MCVLIARQTQYALCVWEQCAVCLGAVRSVLESSAHCAGEQYVVCSVVGGTVHNAGEQCAVFWRPVFSVLQRRVPRGLQQGAVYSVLGALC